MPLKQALHVTTAPLLDPGQGRSSLELPEGLTVAEIVAQAVPGLTPADRHLLRVVLVTEKGAAAVSLEYWNQVRPRAGVQVVIRLVPGKNALRTVLLAVVSVAALALAPAVAGVLGIAGKVGIALVGAGLTIVGSLLVNALVPLPQPEARNNAGERRNTYSIAGWSNTARPNEPVPMIFGRHRYAPPFAAASYTEIVGDTQYVRALFCFGYGPLKIEDIRLGETPISEFDEVEIELREGRVTDAPITLYPQQVLEDAEGVELVRPLPRDDAGKIISGSSIETPVVRTTASDTRSASVILGFPSGLFEVTNDGSVTDRAVSIRIRQRAEGDTTWQTVTTLNLRAARREAFFRQHTWQLPSRGKWEIEITRMTDESPSTQVSDRVTLAGLQSRRPEYPLNINKPLALAAVRMKATYQLNGTLDNFNAVVQRYADAWDGAAWTETLSRNPAAAYVAAVQGPANPYPVTDSTIDWDQLADWHDWCVTKGLKYDRVHDQAESFNDMLRAICAAGRATPRHDGVKWGVVIDRPDSLVIDHINPRNSADFSWSRTYFEPPHAFRVTFSDETNGYALAERLVPWPGHSGSITLTEALELPGKTDPDEIWIEARRRQYELQQRADTFTAIQSGMARVATRGDLVMGSFDVLSRSQLAARVKSVSGYWVELDEMVEMQAGSSYAIRFRQYADASDVIGTSIVRQVVTDTEPSAQLRLVANDALPAVGEVVHFGEMATESLALKVRGVEGGEGFSSVLNMVAAAPEIDTLTDAEVPPVWTGRVGSEITGASIAPPAPRFTRVTSTASYTNDDPAQPPTPGPGTVTVLLVPGTGSAVSLSSLRLEHKLATDSTWTTVTLPVVNGGAEITGYTTEDEINLRAVAIAEDTTESPYTATLSVTVGGDAIALPGQLDAGAIDVVGNLGHARITVATPADPAISTIQIYRVPNGSTLDRNVHAAGAPIAVVAGSTLSHVDGDGTRVNLLANSGFDSSSDWVADANWSIASGLAQHTSGAADTIRQAIALTAGKTYRSAITVSGRTAGSVTPTIFGGTDQSGVALMADGAATDSLVAVTGNTDFGFAASSDFDGQIDDAVLYLETTGSVAAGTYNYWIEPLNDDGNPGPMSGPFSTTII
ncbi:phage tail protein [Ruegeria sediminis]|uniref:Phage tail protein n=1 Tax=Ruegeria sediminis TaxID=2583820 RepID=A0ABY2X391_9RHOB|nr:phage tail protein [Ruegeria sediminis]TMV09813.1 phage tail protein [Ruegeria sediminis]